MRVTIDYLGMEAEGKTLKEAKENARRKAESALKGSYNPVFIRFRGLLGVVFRTPSGWYTGEIHDTEGAFGVCASGPTQTKMTPKTPCDTTSPSSDGTEARPKVHS